jgi:hypothetical protein
VAEPPTAPIQQFLALTASCDKCGGYAFLARCVPDPFKRNGSEIWTYECVDCDNKMQRSVMASDISTTIRGGRILPQ